MKIKQLKISLILFLLCMGMMNVIHAQTIPNTNLISRLKKLAVDSSVIIGGGINSSSGVPNSPNASAILDMSSVNNKGILVPKVALTSNTDQTTIPSPALGLLVYNTGTGALTAQGYLFWNGSEWRTINNSSAISPSVSTISCANATLSPSSYTAGQSYTGTLTIPYTGGNGGVYSASSADTVNGLIFKLQSGTLNYGAGNITFIVSGTPTVSSPTTTTIPVNSTYVPFLTSSESCSAIVGAPSAASVTVAAVMGYMQFVTDANGTKGFQVTVTSPDGLYSVRAFLMHSNQTSAATATNNTTQVQYTDIQIMNNQSNADTIMWNYYTDYGGGFLQDASNSLIVPSGVWGGDRDGATAWYTQTTSTESYWGNEGIYQGSNGGPENRLYTWISRSKTSKTSYTITVMGGAISGNGSTDPSTMKVYIKLEQVAAL